MSDTRDEGTSNRREEPLRKAEVELRKEEIELQRQAIKNQGKGTVAQICTAVAAVTAAALAVFISLNAKEAVDVAKTSVERQAEENRIGTAVNAIKSDGPVAQRIAARHAPAATGHPKAREGQPRRSERH